MYYTFSIHIDKIFIVQHRTVNERSFLLFCEDLPLAAEPLADLAVVHLGVLLRDLPPLHPRPDHERVHRALDVLA